MMVFHRVEEAADVVCAEEAAEPLAVRLNADCHVPWHGDQRCERQAPSNSQRAKHAEYASRRQAAEKETTPAP